MQSTIEIKHLSKEEKLRVMEAIWEDLSREDKGVESPGWHQKALQETERRFSTGDEKIVDWQAAKKELRNRFE
ncbi:MAG: addiction module protein [Thermodesulfobacteriota bacterium]|nr:addiction module protein [Thermodesulfobacteriota bacterium]